MAIEDLNKKIEQEYRHIQSEEKDVDINDLVTDISTVLTGSPAKPKTKAYLKSGTSWVYACIDAIGNEVGNINFKLFQQKQNNDVEEIQQHDILDLLHRANNVTTKFDMLYLIQNYLDLAGEAPLFIAFENNKPAGLLLLRPENLKVIAGKKNGEFVSGYTYKVNTANGVQEVPLEPFEVVLLKNPDPNDQFRGKGVLQAMAETFDTDNFAEQYNRNFFFNSATPSAILQTEKKISQDVRRKLEKKLKQKHGSFENAHKTMILEQGLEWKPMQMSAKEMDFIESQKFTRDKILAMFRVPKSVLGIVEDVNRSNAEASNVVFAQRTIKPKMQRIVEQLNEFLVPLFDSTGTLFLDFEDPVPENRELKLKEAQTGVQAGFVTINEAREMLGLEPLPDGDVLVSNQPDNEGNQTNLLDLGKAKQKKQKANVHMRSLHARTKNLRETQEFVKHFTGQLQKSLQPILKDAIQKENDFKKIQKKKRELKKQLADKKTKSGVTPNKAKTVFHATYLKFNSSFEPKLEEEMSKIFVNQKNRVLKKFGKAKSMKAIDPEQLHLDEAEELELYVNRLEPVQADLIKEQSTQAFALLQIQDRLTRRNKIVKEFLDDRNFRINGVITRETNQQISDVIRTGLAEGQSIAKIKKGLEKKFEQFSKSRAKMIARTETARAASFATEESYKQSQVVDAKEWRATLDERTGALDRFFNGKTVTLGANYANKGDKFNVEGQTVSVDFENVQGPPLHPNCRCVLLPVIN